jgi:NitT/TauT family transport system substrate-binding protein
MNKKRKLILWLSLALVLAVAALGGVYAFQGGQAAYLRFGDNPKLPTLSFYTTGLASTPQMPFWAGVRSGEITSLMNLEVHQWKDLDGLRATVLAGKGDIWLGHIEGFAQARMQGAPISLLAVTGWRKLYFLSKDPALKTIADFKGKMVPFTPPASPGVAVMRSLMQKGAPRFQFAPYEPKRLAMSLVEGKINWAFAPEPLVSVLLAKVPGLEVVGSLEDLYGRLNHCPKRMPIAGIAMNSHTLAKYPALAKELTRIMVKQAKILAENPVSGIDALPRSFEKFAPKKIVENSLKRDLILARPAAESIPEIRAYLKMLLPEKMNQNHGSLLKGDFIAK